jgi:hypothetical protein
MPVTKIRVRLVSVDVLDDSDWLWGAGEWHLHASADGRAFGDPNREFSVHTGNTISLAVDNWSTVVDVSGKPPGSHVDIRLRIIEHDVFSNDDLGEVSARVNCPITNPEQNISRLSPLIDGGWFFSDYRCYRAHFQITIEEEVASVASTGPTAVPVRRNAAGDVTSFSTVSGAAFTPRLEVCPVIPLPGPPAHHPPRPGLPAGLAAGVIPPGAQLTAAPSAPAFNAIPNPAVIPILASGDPDLANRAARLTLTYYEPGNLDTSKFHWRVVSGPAVIIGSNKGISIQARGTGNAADTMATFEVRWESDSGPLLATYRAWVGKVGTLPYRVNYLDGRAGAWQSSAILPPADAVSIMQVVRAILYQAGILMVPDPDTTSFNGASLFPAGNTDGIYRVTVAANRHTRNVNHDVISSSTRYNFRPGAINFAFVHSTSATNAAAVDRNGIAGAASKVQWWKGKLYYGAAGNGSTKDLEGSPSASWIKPSGVPTDGPGVKVTLKTIEPTDRVKQAKGLDKAYVTARNAATPPFTAANMGQLYACHCPVVWGRGNLVGAPPTWTPAQYIWNCGINLAHELGHILGLAHRGSGWSPTPGLSADGMDCKNQAGVLKGHPWDENIMTYGYVLAVPLAHNIDLVQASVVRTHPAITY